jgi:hypothetical protein
MMELKTGKETDRRWKNDMKDMNNLMYYQRYGMKPRKLMITEEPD